MRIRDVMTRDVQVVSPSDSIREAARLMDELNVGVLPVVEGERLVGMVTDRDITVRATAAGLAPDGTQVSQVMSDGPAACYEDDVVSDVARLMGGKQVRRVPVLDAGDRLVGIVSLGDLAVDADRPQTTAEALERISRPAEPDR
jgi:CBS domain-containing protein